MKVRALKALCFKTSKGEVIIKPGQIFKPAEPEKLIHAGLVEPVILPPDQVGRPLWQRPDGSCRVCRTTGAWLSIHNVLVCFTCHPPGCEKLVAQRFGNA